MKNIDLNTIQLLFKKRLPNTHKGNYGHALLIAGNKDKMGAAIVVAKSALRAGAGLAKGGAGDALTGVITAFLAQGYEPINAAVFGVYLHGLAADITLKTQSLESMLITDVIENLGRAFIQIQH